MSQPKWKYIDNFGDVNFLDYGGALLYEDATGIYPPELEVIQEPNEGEKEIYRVYRFSLDRLEPDQEEWFHKDLSRAASCAGMDPDELREWFCSGDLRKRALAYMTVGDYHGYDNLDAYPLELTAKEAKKRYRKELKAA